MCKPGLCPCDRKVNPQLFGDRAKEFDSLEILEGKASMFYQDCYLPFTQSNNTMKKLPNSVLSMLLDFEKANEC